MDEKFGELSHRITPYLLSEYPEFLRCVLQCRRALALSAASLGLLSRETCIPVGELCAELLETENFEGFLADPYSGGKGKILEANINSILAELTSLPPREVAKTNPFPQTTNLAALQLALWHLSESLLLELESLARSFGERSFTEFQGLCELRLQELQEAQAVFLQIHFENSNGGHSTLANEILKEETGLPLALTTHAPNWTNFSKVLSLTAETFLTIDKRIAEGLRSGEWRSEESILETNIHACLAVLGKLRSVELAIGHPIFAGFCLYESLEILGHSLTGYNEYFLGKLERAQNQ